MEDRAADTLRPRPDLIGAVIYAGCLCAHRLLIPDHSARGFVLD
jgi:hypothetical protein